MKAKFIIGLDQGTTGTTALLFDQNRSVVEKSYAEHQQYFPKPGWVEHDPVEIFEKTVSLIHELLRKSKITSDQIAGMGITNQRETSVVWNRNTSKPVYRAIVWQCRRTADECEKLQKIEGFESMVQNQTGLTLDSYFSATKLHWIFQNVSISSEKDLAAGTIDTWLLWNFTRGKVHATDFTNASRTLLFNIYKRQWSEELCRHFQIPMHVLPTVLPSQSCFGNVDRKFFGHEIPILGLIGDQQAALFAHEATHAYQAKCTFGTGAFALAFCGVQPLHSRHRLLTTLAASDDGKTAYALEGSIFMAGSILQWLRDELKIIQHASETDALAEKLATNEGIYLVPAFVGLGAPYWKPNVRGLLTGMHLATNRHHIVRAALESIAYQVKDLFHAMEQDIGRPISQLAVDGGVTQSRFLMQFLSDLLRIPVLKSKVVDMTALGAAKLAAVQLGWSFNNPPQFFETYKPQKNAPEMQTFFDGWKKAVSQALNS